MANLNKAEVMFRQGVAYAAGAMSVQKKLEPYLSQENYEPLPFILNLSFAIELLLKSLLKLENKTTRGHKYIPLFNELSAQTQSKIVVAYG